MQALVFRGPRDISPRAVRRSRADNRQRRHRRRRGEGPFTHRFPLSEGADDDRLFDAREDDVVKVLFTV